MPRIEFDTLFRVDIFHRYYADPADPGDRGVSADFRIEPTAECQRLLSDLGLRFRPFAGGLAVYYEKEASGNPHPLREISAPVKFSFKLCGENPYLMNYSDLPHNVPPGSRFYLHNLNKSVPAAPSSSLRLNAAGDYLSAADLLPYKPQFFQYEEASTAAFADVTITDISGTTIRTGRVAVTEGILIYPVDLREQEPGQYALHIDGAERQRFYAGDEAARQPLFGVIDIFHHPDVSASYRFVEPNGDISAKTYTLDINRRATTWEYRVVLQHRENADNLAIEAPAALGVSFAKGAATLLPDGRQAVPFVSSAPLPLRKKPLKNIVLKETGGSELVANLPNPAIYALTTRPGDSNVYSEIYIYV